MTNGMYIKCYVSMLQSWYYTIKMHCQPRVIYNCWLQLLQEVTAFTITSTPILINPVRYLHSVLGNVYQNSNYLMNYYLLAYALCKPEKRRSSAGRIWPATSLICWGLFEGVSSRAHKPRTHNLRSCNLQQRSHVYQTIYTYNAIKSVSSHQCTHNFT